MDLLKIAEYGFMVMGALNVLIAGLRAMGWTKPADECQKIENAISAMREALIKQFLNKGGNNVQNQEPVVRGSVDAAGSGSGADTK